jgi:hypothetical protein
MGEALTGGCGCGAVRFELTAPLVSATYRHCTRCQRRTGTGASANGRTAPGTFRIVAGEDRLRAWRPEGGAEKWFCGDCGTALFSSTGGDDPQIGVRLGACYPDSEATASSVGAASPGSSASARTHSQPTDRSSTPIAAATLSHMP